MLGLLGIGLAGAAARAEVHFGNPTNYRMLVASLQAGDTLLLEAGTYDRGLPIVDLLGQRDRPIVIEGPASGPPALFLGSSARNTISITRSGYVTIRNLRLDGLNDIGDGVKAEGTGGNFAHHITLEDLIIENHDADQQIVGVSTKCPAWDWVIRRCVIRRCGTGVYLGDSNGTSPFVNGLIEYNLIVDTIGYNLQIKHQVDRPALPGLPRNGTTVLRHNVFSKAQNGSSGDLARPCVLVGHWPLSGDGSSDVYQMYGNFFYENPNEALFQGEGNVALYDNLFVQRSGAAVNIQPHNDVPRSIRVFHNTVLASGRGIRVSGGDAGYQQKVVGNAVFAADPIQAPDQQDNVTDTLAAAGSYLVNPTGALGALDLYPLAGALTGPAIDTSLLQGFLDWDRDFNGALHPATFRGAYGGQGQNPGWLPQLEIKPAPGGPPATPTQAGPTFTPTVTPTPGPGVPAPGPRPGPLAAWLLALVLALRPWNRPPQGRLTARRSRPRRSRTGTPVRWGAAAGS
jgi:hypothetical protein